MAEKRETKRTVKKKEDALPAKNTGRKKTEGERERREDRGAVARILIPIVLFVVAAFLLVCLIAQTAKGGMGNPDMNLKTYPVGVVSYVLMYGLGGLFGYSLYVLPLALVWLAVMWNRLAARRALLKKVILLFSMLFFVSAFVYVMAHGFNDTVTQDAPIDRMWKQSANLAGGGIIGGYLGILFYFAVRVPGTLLLGIPAFLIMIVFLFDINVKTLFEKWLKKREMNRQEREEREFARKKDEEENEFRSEKAGKKGKEKAEKEEMDDENLVPMGLDEVPRRRTALSYDDEPDPGPAEPEPEQSGSRKDRSDLFMEPDEFFDAVSEISGEEPGARREEEEREDDRKSRPEPEEDAGAVPYTAVDIARTQDRQARMADSILPQDRELVTSKRSAASRDFFRIFDEDEGKEEAQPEPEETSVPEQPPVPEETAESEEEDALSGDCVREIDQKESGKPAEAKEPKPVPAPVPAEPKKAEPEKKPYRFPPISFLSPRKPVSQNDKAEIEDRKRIIRETLRSFHIEIDGEIKHCKGPTITRYEFKQAAGIRVNTVVNLQDDLAMALSAKSIRMEAPIPGKPAIGLEVANLNPEVVPLRSLIESDAFRNNPSKIAACLGEDIEGNPIVFDIKKMPHLLVAGATGMGKSVCINSIIMSILYHATSDEVKLILVDPKTVEFKMYKDIPHLAVPIITDPQIAAGALKALCQEMDHRFELIASVGRRDIAGYNEIIKGDPEMKFMPQIVLIIDELADLMMTAGKDIESSVIRIAQKARACGIHLIIGTQRPSVDVITGVMKANIPSRIAFTVASQVDSRTILDQIGAEKLIGRGDMLYSPVGSPSPVRVQGSLVKDEEVEQVVNFIIKYNGKAVYDEDLNRAISQAAASIGQKGKNADDGADKEDEDDGENKVIAALQVGIQYGRMSTSLLQRKLKIGYGRAAKIIDILEEKGYVSASEGAKGRTTLVTEDQLEQIIASGDLKEE
ncbi:MAG: DNA translocase FtsK [Clostridia bacterium]|nr:DNA translocase FtsK [Clostridia bacterium]